MNALILVSIFLTSPMLSIYADKEFLLIPTGALYFSDHEHILKFELNLNAYYSNANMIQNNTNRLEVKCKENANITDCNYFHSKFKEIADYATKETHFLQSTRNKRELFCTIVAAMAVTITTAIASFFIGAATALSSQKELVEQQNLQLNSTINQIRYQTSSLVMENMSTNALFEDVHLFKGNFSEIQQINQLLSTTLLGIDKHNKDTEKYLNALSNNLKDKFFSIIDIGTFNETLHDIKTNLSENFLFSTLHPKDVINLSSLESEMINNTISITIHIPIMQKEKYNMLYLIPIPITRDNNDFILNTDAKHIIQNNFTTTEITLATLAQCMQTKNITICNTLLIDQILPLNKCIKTILSNETTEAICSYKRLPHKNQFIKISENSIYAYIIEPTLLKISCGQYAQILNLNVSTEIRYEKHCKIYKPINKQSQNFRKTVVQIDSEHTEPNFAIFENQKWTNNLLFLNQYNNEMQHLFRGLKQHEMNFKQRSKLVDFSEPDFSIFPKGIFDEMILYASLCIMIPIGIIFSITCLSYFRNTK